VKVTAAAAMVQRLLSAALKCRSSLRFPKKKKKSGLCVDRLDAVRVVGGEKKILFLDHVTFGAFIFFLVSLHSSSFSFFLQSYSFQT